MFPISAPLNKASGPVGRPRSPLVVIQSLEMKRREEQNTACLQNAFGSSSPGYSKELLSSLCNSSTYPLRARLTLANKTLGASFLGEAPCWRSALNSSLLTNSSRHFSLRKYRPAKGVVASQQYQAGKFQEISYISQKSEVVLYSCLQALPGERRTHGFGFSPNRVYHENTNTAAPAEDHHRGPEGRRPGPAEPPHAGRGPNRAGDGRRGARPAQEEEEAPQQWGRAADAAGPAGPRPGQGGDFHRRRVGHGVRRRLEPARRRRGVPPARLPLRGAGHQEGGVRGRDVPPHPPGRCAVLRAGGDAAGVLPRRCRHAQLLARGGCWCGVQPGGGDGRLTEEPGKAAGGLGARPFLAQPSKPAAVLKRVCPALKMLHLFKVILRFLHDCPHASASEGKKKSKMKH